MIQSLLEAAEGSFLVDRGSAESAADGAFRLSSLEPIHYDVTARKDDFIEAKALKVFL